MWIPASEEEILAAIDAGDLIETATFDAKRALPSKGKSKDLAIDGAAMATDGGTLLYGVGENENREPTVPKPFSLAGARERVDQIVRTSISEPPAIEVRAIPTDDDPSLGYLVISVPASPRAPHMVTVGKEYRYYGRSATGNVPLSEGEVARLYERRQRWEVDRDAMLEQAIESAPIPPHDDFAYLHLVVRPVVTEEDLFDRASEGQEARQFLGGLISAASSAEALTTRFSPDLHGGYNHERRADGWAASWGLGIEWEEREDPSRVLDLEVGLDGSGRMFCGRAAQRDSDHLLVFEPLVAGLTAKFLAVMGGLYAAGGYLGPVDVGMAVTGLKGGVSYLLRDNPWIDRTPYNKDWYRRTERLPASQLVGDSRGAARMLVSPLLRAITRESYDPFSE
jgi:hypothetical protein